MSHNQASGKRKSGPSDKHRNFSAGGGEGSSNGVGANANAAAPSSNNIPALISNRSSEKHSNVQERPSRVCNQGDPALTPDSNTHLTQQYSSHGLPDAPVSSSNIKPAAIEPAGMDTEKATPAPSSPLSGSDSKALPSPATTEKAPVEAYRSFHIQFGSTDHGLLKGIQVPAWTSSAPPNLDEIKHSRALHDSFEAPSNIPPPSGPKEQILRKDVGMVDHTKNTSEGHAAGGGGKGSASSMDAPAPAPAPSSSPSSNNNPALTFTRRFEKHSKTEEWPPIVSNESAPVLTLDTNSHLMQRALQNGAHPQQQSSHAPVEAPRSSCIQFGSINVGLLNGIQVPAGTSSAPPNLDEQKCDQACHDSFKALSTIPLPPPFIPKQQLQRRDAGMVDETKNTSEGHAAVNPKREMPISASPRVSHTQKPFLHPFQGLPMQMQFAQHQMPAQFGGHCPQIQSQAMSATSLQILVPIPLAMGNQPVQQPILVSDIHCHAVQPHGMIHQWQPSNFTSQLGPELAPQLGYMSMNMGQQFPHKAVKITHPDTHEELKFDGSPARRAYPNMIPQSQSMSSFQPAHGINYYSNPNYYNVSSLPLGSSVPPTSQPTRLYNQVTVKSAGGHVDKDHASSVGSPRGVKAESQKLSILSPKDFETSAQTLKPGPRSTSTPVTSANKAAVALASDTFLGPINLGSNADTLPLDEVGGEPTTGSGLLPQEAVAVGNQNTAFCN